MQHRRLKKRRYRDADGKQRVSRCWYAWIPQPTGGLKLVSTGCTNRDAAEARAAELERLAVDSTYAAAATALERVLSDYVKSRKRMGRADATIAFVAQKAGTIGRVFIQDWGLTRAADVTHAALLKYIDARLEEGARRTTIKKELRVLAAAWKLARKNGAVLKSTEEIIPELDDDARPKKRWLTPLELVGLATVLPANRMAQIAFMVATGAEVGAVARAKASDVDGWRVHVHGKKRATRDRWVPVVLPEQRILLRWALANADGGIGGRLFSAWANIRRDFIDAAKKIGIEPFSPNDLRRTYSTWLVGEGKALAHIAPAMGHKDTRMLERHYGRPTPEMVERLLLAGVARPMLGSAEQPGDNLGFSRNIDETENEAKTTGETAENEGWSGTESNCRHADFQSPTTAAIDREIASNPQGSRSVDARSEELGADVLDGTAAGGVLSSDDAGGEALDEPPSRPHPRLTDADELAFEEERERLTLIIGTTEPVPLVTSPEDVDRVFGPGWTMGECDVRALVKKLTATPAAPCHPCGGES
jgi:integrase